MSLGSSTLHVFDSDEEIDMADLEKEANEEEYQYKMSLIKMHLGNLLLKKIT